MIFTLDSSEPRKSDARRAGRDLTLHAQSSGAPLFWSRLAPAESEEPVRPTMASSISLVRSFASDLNCRRAYLWVAIASKSARDEQDHDQQADDRPDGCEQLGTVRFERVTGAEDEKERHSDHDRDADVPSDDPGCRKKSRSSGLGFGSRDLRSNHCQRPRKTATTRIPIDVNQIAGGTSLMSDICEAP